MVRVLICDDQTVVREGLAAILSTEPEIEVVGLAGDGQEALALAGTSAPDVVLIDLQMPVMDGVEATRQLRGRYPGLYVLILTTYADDEWLFAALQAGAHGYLLKDTRRDDLIGAIKGTVAGQSYLDPAVARRVMDRATAAAPVPAQDETLAEAFTDRELDILRLLVRGYSNPEIARHLHLARGTVRNYVSVILQKLEVSDRTQAAVAALQRGLVDGVDS